MIYPKNLLIVRTDRIGDVVLSLPLAGMIKDRFPECKITFLVRNYTKDIVAGHPFIDEIIILEEKNGRTKFFQNVENISLKNYDYSIVVYPTFLISLIVFSAGISKRIGTGYRWYSLLFNKKVFAHRRFAEKHELEFNVDLLKEIDIVKNVSPGNIAFDLRINEESKKEVEKILLKNGINIEEPIIIVHPGSGGSAVDLPLTKFNELIILLNTNLKARIILTGSKSEINLCESLVTSDEIKNFAGILNLSQLTAMISMSDIFISNSTGPIHIAAALGKYVVGFYPKILSCSAKRWGPYSTKSLIFTPEINCENCTRGKCEKINCMNSINIKNVFAEINNIYKFIVNNGEINA